MTGVHRGPRPRKGFALPAALFVLTVIGLFIAATAFAALQESRAALGGLAQRAALEAAEYGAAAVLRDWSAAWNTGVPVGSTIGPTGYALAGGASAVVRITRGTPTVWWVVSEGLAGGTLARRAARRTVNAVLRLDVDADSSLPLAGVPASVRIARLGAALPIRVRDRWWQQF
jgi:hypothetical protein